MENYGNYNSKCILCSTEIIFKGLKIISPEETLKEIIINKKSISRFGDGEFNLTFGKSIYFQKKDQELSNKLINILKNKEKGLLIGINLPLKKYAKYYNIKYKKFWLNWFEKNKFLIAKLIDKNKKYYSSNLSRFYMLYKLKYSVPNYIKKLKKIWDKKDILIAEGNHKKFGVNNDLLDNAKSIKRIICPNKNAFNVYNKILNNIIKVNKRTLILLSLGPTASVLAYDLYKLGYQVIDVGHMDYEYNVYRNQNKNILKNKYINRKNKYKKYHSEIIEKILK